MNNNEPSYLQMVSRGTRRLLSIEEVATLLNVSPRTIRNRLLKNAKNPFPVKPKRIGKRVLFDSRMVDHYIDNL